MAVTRIPVRPGLTQLDERGDVLESNRFRELGSRPSPLEDDELMNHHGPSDEELRVEELKEGS